MEQLLLHLLGDYITQSHWMAENKVKDSRAAFIHAGIYTLPFLMLTRSIPALALIFFSHAAIDRFRLARYVIWAKNWMGPGPIHSAPWADCQKTGFQPDVPDWLAVWLLIVVDNTLHLTINYVALRWL